MFCNVGIIVVINFITIRLITEDGIIRIVSFSDGDISGEESQKKRTFRK